VSLRKLRDEGPDAELRFLREARSAGRLSHPNIVTIYDIGETDTLAYIAMEYLHGSTLRELMDRSLLPQPLALDTACQIAGALAFAHERGVVHRDIKPANIIVTGHQGRIKLTDFGIAHLINSNQTQSGHMLGSPRYMSPEQAMGREIDGRSDIFSLGSVLYEMLTGRYAFDGDSLAAIAYQVIYGTPEMHALPDVLPASLVTLLHSMLDKQPNRRPHAREVTNTLAGMLAPPIEPPAPIPARRPLRAAAFAGLGVLLAVGTSVIVIEHFLPAPPPVVTADAVPAPSLGAPGAPSAPSQHTPSPAASSDAAPAPSSTVSKASSAPQQTASATPPQRESRAQAGPPPIIADAYLLKLDEAATELRIERTKLLLRYTEQHPDVAQIDRKLEQLRKERRRHVRQLQKEQQQAH